MAEFAEIHHRFTSSSMDLSTTPAASEESVASTNTKMIAWLCRSRAIRLV